MSDVEIRESADLTLPHSGELIDLHDAAACANALAEIRRLEQGMRDAKSILSGAIVAESRRQGSKTLYLDGVVAEVRGGTDTVWDLDALEDGLRAAGLPDDRIRDVIKEEVTWKVNAREAQRVAKSNPDYAAVVERASMAVEKPPTVVLRQP